MRSVAVAALVSVLTAACAELPMMRAAPVVLERCEGVCGVGSDPCDRACVSGPPSVLGTGVDCGPPSNTTPGDWPYTDPRTCRTPGDSSDPVPFRASVWPRDLVAWSARGAAHTCGNTRDGRVVCWGSNDWGQLGDGRLQSRAAPRVVEGIEGARVVEVGPNRSCAIGAGGRTWCWGVVDYGNSRIDAWAVPVEGPTIPGAVELAVGRFHACARRSDGRVACWGRAGRWQLGRAAAWDSVGGPELIEVDGVRAIRAGSSHTCALRSDGSVWCWGTLGAFEPDTNSLGYACVLCSSYEDPEGYEPPFREPRRVLDHARAIESSEGITCALLDDGRVSCLRGAQTICGQHGHQGPEIVDGIDGAIEIAVGDEQVCALTARGDLLCADHRGERAWLLARRIDAPAGATHLWSGARHVCVEAAGGVACWGQDERGQLGSARDELRGTLAP